MNVQNGKGIHNRKALIIFILLGILIVSGLVVFFMRDRGNAPGHTEVDEEHHEEDVIRLDNEGIKNVGIRVEAVQVREVTQTVSAVGVVSPDETRVAHLRPLARGRIQKVFVRLGDRVVRGQPLFIYDNIELGELVGEYIQALAQAEVAQRYLERAEQLIGIGAVARAEYDQRKAQYKEALAQVEKIEIKMRRFGVSNRELDRLRDPREEIFRQQISLTTLRSPQDGVIIWLDAVPGETVDQEEEICTIADLSTVWVQARIYEKDIAVVEDGRECYVTVEAYPDRTFSGKVTYISDFLDPSTRTSRLRCEIENPEGLLRLEMFANVHIPVKTGRQAFMVPHTAIQWIDNLPVVFIEVESGTFEKRAVEIGEQGDGWVEIVKGVEEGEKVVVEGGFYLKSIFLRERIGDEH